jgi:glycerate 2-kinase
MTPFNWLTFSLEQTSHGGCIQRILSAAIQAVDPRAAVRRNLTRDGDILLAEGLSYDLNDFRRIWVVGAGKAGAPMAQAVDELISDRLTGGLVIVKDGYSGGLQSAGPIELAEASHPLPDERGLAATRRLVDLLHDIHPDDLVICLISGGGSALMVWPVPGVSLDDLQALTASLLRCGATIDEINTLRKHLDKVKGGGLARLAAPARLLTLILSDVVGDPLDVIASGPTVPDRSTFAAAWQILQHYRLLEQIPSTVIETLQGGLRNETPETPKSGDPAFSCVQNVIVGSNLQAAQAAMAQARKEGLNTLLLTSYLEGEARQAGQFLAAIARQMTATEEPVRRPACIMAGGETTVTLRGPGRGGRNQELALGAVKKLAGLPEAFLISLATDGGDGPTDAAGAVVTGQTLVRARQAGMDPEAFLRENNAYAFFEALGDLLRPGPTLTNVNDLVFIFLF